MIKNHNLPLTPARKGTTDHQNIDTQQNAPYVWLKIKILILLDLGK